MVSLAEIRATPQISDLLAEVCEFDLARVGDDFHAWHLSPVVASRIIAGDLSGGEFVAYGDGPVEALPVMFVSSEGQAGRMAKDCTELLQILIALPDWHDLLKFSAGGRLAEMRQSAELLSRRLNPDLLRRQRGLFSELGLDPLADAVATLHAAVTEGLGFRVLAEDDTPYESLFNTFDAASLGRGLEAG
jgi:hypothetical protein